MRGYSKKNEIARERERSIRKREASDGIDEIGKEEEGKRKSERARGNRKKRERERERERYADPGKRVRRRVRTVRERKVRVRERVNVIFLGNDNRIESEEVKGGREIEWL